MKIERTLAFLDICRPEQDLATLIAEFHRTIETFGFPHCACGGWVGLGKQRRYRFYFNSWPQDWLNIYTTQNVFTDDPVVREAIRRTAAFAWSGLTWTQLGQRARQIHQLARDFGWTEVVGIPAHGPAGYQGLVSLGTMAPVDLAPRDLALLRAVGLAMHDRCRMEDGLGVEQLPVPLTPREIECLQWAAVGKTDWEIGQVLDIKASTAHYHIEQAKKKLNVVSRVQAVALAVLRGLI